MLIVLAPDGWERTHKSGLGQAFRRDRSGIVNTFRTGGPRRK
nr:hypothetical protein [Kibdelosporangium sp. MJ126-NF4]CTQ95005.1 hypothetical protein [Kibdelosporangium sp. MJ126-NF4]